jgi:hypothetical protein
MFDPAANQQKLFDGEGIAPRSEHVAVLLSSGNVLLMGGIVGDSGLVTDATWETYDPRSRTFQPANGTTPISGVGFAAAPVGNGALACGGARHIVGPPENFEPQADCLNIDLVGVGTPADPLPVALQHLAMVALPDGRVLACGGSTEIEVVLGPTVAATDRAFVYDPNAAPGSHWTEVQGLNHPRMMHRAIAMNDGRILVTGGVSSGGFHRAGDDVVCPEIFDPATGAFTDGDPCSRAGAGASPVLVGQPGIAGVVVEGYQSGGGGGLQYGTVAWGPPTPPF